MKKVVSLITIATLAAGCAAPLDYEAALNRGHAVCAGAGFGPGNERAACVAHHVQTEMNRAGSNEHGLLGSIIGFVGTVAGLVLLGGIR